jgi:hypothetical protein
MEQRSPVTVLILGCITFGIYPLLWLINTKEELNVRGAEIPTAWFLIIPILNLLWMWKYCQGAEKVTREGVSAVMAFAMLAFLGPIGMFVLQGNYNKLALPAAA